MQLSTSFIALISLLTVVNGASYTRTDKVVGPAFNEWFAYQAMPDPTKGRVNYVNKATAQAQNLTFASADTFILRADSTKVVPAGSLGRDSIRMRSHKSYTTHVVTMDIRHMPQGCGTWPAVWEVQERDYPNLGEVDIVEGVNDLGPNASTLHSSAGCSMRNDTSQMTGTWKHLNCEVNGSGGCSVASPSRLSYGPPFNANGGGIYALERTETYMKVWFWPRGTAPPADINANSVNPDAWGKPAAYFSNAQCDFKAKFGAHHVIINLTLCGSWASNPNVYPKTCPQTCISHVDNNPAAFREAYWDFKYLNVYQ